MASRKLNVLVYTGTGTTVTSVRHCIYSLRRLLSANYAVIPVTDAVLLKEPWAPTCALLVFPGGADLGYCRALNGEGNRIITGFVRRGGAFLGFCAGGYYGSARCEFEVGDPGLEVVGSRELAFFPGTCRGGAFRGFAYHSEEGARAARVRVRREAFPGAGVLPDELACYCNGGGLFVDAAAMADRKVEVLATYADRTDVDGGSGSGGDGPAALVYCGVGEGAALLTGPHVEFAAVNLAPQPGIPGYEELRRALAADDAANTSFLKACLAKLGLEVNQDTSSVPPLSKLHVSAIDPQDAGGLVHSWQDIITREDGEEMIRAESDTFRIDHADTRWSVGELKAAVADAGDGREGPEDAAAQKRAESKEAGDAGIVDYNAVVKTIVCHEEEWPASAETPYFSHHLFYSSLREYRRLEQEADDWGDALMYGEVVTSTNTLLEKNHKLLSKLPTGFTFAATTQIAARGRGANVWVAPVGSLIMSTVINHPAQYAATRPIVFIQYLAGVAIVEAIKSYGPGYEDVPVKLKWPNDIYARDPTKPASEPPSYVKIGGILANCAYSSGNYQIVLGIGINATNSRPTTSLDALLPLLAPASSPRQRRPPAPFRIERLVARILTRLETLYRDFLRHGFTRDLEDRYYAHWLHTGQEVTLEAEGVRARVLGITRDWGLLRAEEIGLTTGRPTGRVWALQSDENSFDFWRGLVRRKT